MQAKSKLVEELKTAGGVEPSPFLPSNQGGVPPNSVPPRSEDDNQMYVLPAGGAAGLTASLTIRVKDELIISGTSNRVAR